MQHTKLHHRCPSLALIAVVCAIIAGHQTTFAQDSPEYIQFLQQNSMIYEADQEADVISGQGVQWRHSYQTPEAGQLVTKASTWFLDYPASVIPKPNTSVIGTWADSALWDDLQSVGIQLLHTDPIERAGGIEGTNYTQTIDGWFDRISLDLDPVFGPKTTSSRCSRPPTSMGPSSVATWCLSTPGPGGISGSLSERTRTIPACIRWLRYHNPSGACFPPSLTRGGVPWSRSR